MKITCDAIKVAYRQSKDGFVVSFAIHPSDMNVDLANADIGSQWQLSLVPLDDDGNGPPDTAAAYGIPVKKRNDNRLAKHAGLEKAVKAAVKHAAHEVGRLTLQARITCRDPVFWRYLTEHEMPVDNQKSATAAVYLICSVKSRKEFVPGTRAASEWDGLYSKFLAWRDAPERAA